MHVTSIHRCEYLARGASECNRSDIRHDWTGTGDCHWNVVCSHLQVQAAKPSLPFTNV